MFIHQGNGRTPMHNLQIASLLSFVAGIVNVTGFLAIATLTTNVTGHFTFLVDEVLNLDFWKVGTYFLYINFFLFGSFSSNFLVEILSRRSTKYVYIVPTTIESIILFIVAVLGKNLIISEYNIVACCLLFSMGLQNSLVTRISNASIRTTHLTGLFTDLGIEFSQLFFYHENESRQKLLSSIILRLTIISFFFIGGIVGGIFYSKFGISVLFVASTSLILGIIYDYIKIAMS
jgi:uncharacterized membrane protein YoaK (UPF0700 family)